MIAFVGGLPSFARGIGRAINASVAVQVVRQGIVVMRPISVLDVRMKLE